MRTIDISLAGNIKTLAQLSYAFGVSGSAFALKYFYDFHLAAIKLPAVFYMLTIGIIFLTISLVLSPAAYKSMLPRLNAWISRGEHVISKNPGDPASTGAKLRILCLKFFRLLLLCSHPCFFLLLVAAVLH